jgi:hypothetical protein
MDTWNNLDKLDKLFVVCAFLFHVILIIHFGLRKQRFEVAKRYGPIVYALGVPPAALSILPLSRSLTMILLTGALFLSGEGSWRKR